MSYTVQSLAQMTDEERAVQALPPVLQRRMAKLVLGGWVIRSGYHPWPEWVAEHDEATWPVGENYYSSSTLMTLLDKMVGVIEEMEQ